MGHQKEWGKTRQISYEEANEIAKTLGLAYVEIDAKNEYSVENLFSELIAKQALEFYKNKEYEQTAPIT